LRRFESAGTAAVLYRDADPLLPMQRQLRACRDRMLPLDGELVLQFSTSSALAGAEGQESPYPTAPAERCYPAAF